MPKRINLTLSDEAVERLQKVPYHSRGAYVSGLIVADGGRGSTGPGARRCKCGVELSGRVYFDNGVWAATEGDLAAYRAKQTPAHDVIASTGKRLRLGTCVASKQGDQN